MQILETTLHMGKSKEVIDEHIRSSENNERSRDRTMPLKIESRENRIGEMLKMFKKLRREWWELLSPCPTKLSCPTMKKFHFNITQVLKEFSLPKMKIYDGMTDLVDYIAQFKQPLLLLSFCSMPRRPTYARYLGLVWEDQFYNSTYAFLQTLYILLHNRHNCLCSSLQAARR